MTKLLVAMLILYALLLAGQVGEAAVCRSRLAQLGACDEVER